jgi:formylglycine-generating enzyme required for sulfatase activity
MATHGIEFVLVPGGSAYLGLSEEEEQAALRILKPLPFNRKSMRPVRHVTLPTFLMSVAPVSVPHARKILGHARLNDDVFGTDVAPSFVQRQSAVAVARAVGCRLPTEDEWEYACRAGTRTLFPWGSTLGSVGALDGWMNLLKPGKWKRNRFGLKALFTGEWCLDEWAPSRAPDARKVPGVFVVRGGASVFWPWEGPDEWRMCMPAYRMPSTNLFDDRRCGVRLVHEIPLGSERAIIDGLKLITS